MIIEVKTNVYWDTESQTQSTEALEWFSNNVRVKMGMLPSDTSKVQPTYDQWHRPVEWVFNFNGFSVNIIRHYCALEEPTWALDYDEIIFTTN